MASSHDIACLIFKYLSMSSDPVFVDKEEIKRI